MKTNLYFLLFTLILFASCSSLQQSAVNDDIYYSPKDEPAVSNVDYYNQSSNSMNKTAIVDRKNDETISALLENETIEDIDTVILTHAHPDHINGNTLDNGQLAFPNARYFMSKTEWDFWNSGEAEATLDEKIKDVLLSVTRQNLPPIAHKVELVEGDKVIIPGIRCIAAPGHTPGHMVLLISSEEDQLLHMVDTVLHPIHIEYPEWHSIFDYNPDCRWTSTLQAGFLKIFRHKPMRYF